MTRKFKGLRKMAMPKRAPNMLRRFLLWMGMLFDRRTLRSIRESVGKGIELAKRAMGKRPLGSMGELIWNSQRKGTFRRQKSKIGRNDPCPCGKLRIEPRDTTKPAKAKHCCGVPAL